MNLPSPRLTLLASLFTAWALSPARAQTVFTPVPVTGFTDDVVADGRGPAVISTTNPADQGVPGNRFAFVAPSYISPAGVTPLTSLPASGLINSVGLPGLSFQLAPYNGRNSLRLAGSSAGSLTLVTPRAAQIVWVAGASGNGTPAGTPVDMTVVFTDGSSQSFVNNVPDWYGGTGYAIQGVSRVNIDTDVFDNRTNEPRIYQFPLVLLPANYGKLVQRVSFAKAQPPGGGILNIFNGLAITLSSSCGLPAGSITQGGPAVVCPGTAVPLLLLQLGIGSGYAGQWQQSVDGGSTWTDLAGATASNYTATPPVTTRYRYRATCGTSETFLGPTTVVVAVPTAALAYDNAAYCRTGRSTAPVSSPAGGQFSAPGGLALDPTTGVIDLGASTAGTYRVAYTGPGTCPATATAQVLIKGDELPVFPNVITPNNDGLNDGLLLRLSEVTAFDMHVYNRWGRQVWQGQNPAIGWAAQQSSPGVYYYEVNYTDCAARRQHYKGWVEVVK